MGHFIVDMNEIDTLALNYSRLVSVSDRTDSGFLIKTSQDSDKTVVTNNGDNPATAVYTVCDNQSGLRLFFYFFFSIIKLECVFF